MSYKQEDIFFALLSAEKLHGGLLGHCNLSHKKIDFYAKIVSEVLITLCRDMESEQESKDPDKIRVKKYNMARRMLLSTAIEQYEAYVNNSRALGVD